MFTDPIGTINVSLPPRWAFDPRSSSLIHLAFFDWMSPLTQELFVSVVHSLTTPDKTDYEWEMAVRAELPTEATRIERRGTVIFVELQGREENPGTRLAWVRGLRCSVIIEQRGVPPGSVLKTPELSEALRTLDVPINYRVVKWRTKAEWNEEIDAAEQICY